MPLVVERAYGENSLSCAHVFQWYKRVSEGQESTEDDQDPGQPFSTPQTVTKINEIVCGDHCINIRMIAQTVNANKETARKILYDKLNMNKVCVKLVPKTLNPMKSSSIDRSAQIFLST